MGDPAMACDVSLQALNSFAFAVRARRLYRLREPAQLAVLPPLCQQYPDWLILGGGSNVLLQRDLDGLVIHNGLSGMNHHQLGHGRVLLDVAAGENWHALVRHTVAAGLWGLENLTLIPGSVGASPIQNIGAYGVELKDVFHSLLAMDLLSGETRMFDRNDCRFGYRDSFFKQDEGRRWLITRVRLILSTRAHPVIGYRDLAEHLALLKPARLSAQLISDAVAEIRRRKLPDPDVLPNAGSFFKNPVISRAHWRELQCHYPQAVHYPLPDGNIKLAAAWLIDQLGWKGREIAGAAVHENQALVLINKGGGAQAVLALAAQIAQSVKSRFGVELEIEPSVR